VKQRDGGGGSLLLSPLPSGSATGSKRASKEPEEFEESLGGVDPRAAMAGMTEEQKKFLMWYYRTEDRE